MTDEQYQGLFYDIWDRLCLLCDTDREATDLTDEIVTMIKEYDAESRD